MSNVVALPDLAANEAVIERGMRSFVEVGAALADIRDRKQYPQPTFESYVRERWGFNRDWAYQQIEAAQVVGNVGTYLQRSTASLLAPLPVERQRELAPAIADMTVREAREYVRAAEAPPDDTLTIVEPYTPQQDVSAEYRALMRAMKALLDLRPTVNTVRMNWTPEQKRLIQERAAITRRLVEYISDPQLGRIVLEVQHNDD